MSDSKIKAHKSLPATLTIQMQHQWDLDSAPFSDLGGSVLVRNMYVQWQVLKPKTSLSLEELWTKESQGVQIYLGPYLNAVLL